MGAPPVPFYLIAPTRFTPAALQTSNADGALGDGTFEGSFAVVGHILFLNLQLTWGTTTAGTGNVLLTSALNAVYALPLGFTGLNLDTDNMARSSALLIPSCPCEATQNVAASGGFKAVPSGVLVVSPAATLANAIDGAIAAGDTMAWDMRIPLLEPNMPR